MSNTNFYKRHKNFVAAHFGKTVTIQTLFGEEVIQIPMPQKGTAASKRLRREMLGEARFEKKHYY